VSWLVGPKNLAGKREAIRIISTSISHFLRCISGMSDQSRQRVRVFEWRVTDPAAQNFIACDDVVIRQAARPDEAPSLLFDALSSHGSFCFRLWYPRLKL
jgi:hypothetical protein